MKRGDRIIRKGDGALATVLTVSANGEFITLRHDSGAGRTSRTADWEKVLK
jgi:hypothetical protein